MRNPDAIRLILRLACFLPLAAAPVLTDWICGLPFAERRIARALDPVLDTLDSGKPIWASDDMRTLKEAWIARMPVRRDVLILGSSRAIQISAEWFQPRSMFNAAVLGGDFGDMVGIFEACVKTGKVPREVLLDLNPTLSWERKEVDVRPLARHFRHALARYQLFPPMRFFMDTLSMGQLHRNIRRLQSPLWSFPNGPGLRAYPVQPDGSGSLALRVANPTPEEIEAAVISNLRDLTDDVRRWRTTSDPDGFDLKLFRHFLDDLQGRGIRVTVLLAPVHPVAYEYFSKLGGYNETWIRREMASRKIPIVGSYSPAITRTPNADFYDEVHSRAHVLRRLLAEAGVIEPERR